MKRTISQEMIDAQRTVAIPAGGASAKSAAVDGGNLAPIVPDLLPYVELGALTTGQLPDGETITYTLIESNDPALATSITETVMGIQKGAGGAGAGKAIFGARPAYAGGKYFGLKIAASASANAAGVSVTLNWTLIAPLS